MPAPPTKDQEAGLDELDALRASIDAAKAELAELYNRQRLMFAELHHQAGIPMAIIAERIGVSREAVRKAMLE